MSFEEQAIQDRDVLIIGAGPAGSAAAKRCAEHGLSTLMLEKRRLPRDKVCSGMLVGQLARRIVREEFGEVPQDVLVAPHYLDGYTVHVPGAAPQSLERKTPISWRRDLDYWLVQKAKEAGAEVRDGVRVTDIVEKDKGYAIRVISQEKEATLRARFIIGADGATSVVRKSLCPNLGVMYSQCYREVYEAETDLAPGFFHFFCPPWLAPYYFTAYCKGGFLLVELAGKMGETRRIIGEARHFLARNHGFDLSKEPVRRDGCLEPILYRELLSGSFIPAEGNALLVGDAAGLEMPVTGEGISTALKSGLEAATAIACAIETGVTADQPYLKELKGLLSQLETLYSLSRRIREQSTRGAQPLSEALTEAWKQALQLS